jgi:peptide/nickel transport system substrate-binding protein
MTVDNRAFKVLMASIAILVMVATPLYSPIASAQDDAEEETVLKIGFMQAIDFLNPMLGLIDSSYVFYGLVYDYPIVIDNDLNYIGNLVTDIVCVPETDPEMVATGRPYGSVWDYTMTDHAKWHDGEPFSAEDYAWNLNILATHYVTLWAFQPFTYFLEKAEVQDDGKTVRVYFWDRDSETPQPCSFGYMFTVPLLPRHLLQDENPDSLGFQWDGLIEGSDPPIVGTGPFKVTDRIEEEFLAGDHITLVRNDEYHWAEQWGKEINFDKIIMKFYDDATSMRIALTEKELDVAGFPPDNYQAIKDNIEDKTYENLEAFDGPHCTFYWNEIEFCMNEEGGPNRARLDIALRQALHTATNKSHIVNHLYKGLADEGNTLIPAINEYWHYEPTGSEVFNFDLARAAEMLDEAGYIDIDDDGLREVTEDSYTYEKGWEPVGQDLVFEMIVRNNYPEERLIADYLKSTWNTIGVDLDIKLMDEATMSKIVYSYDYDTCIWYWSSDVDPNYMLFCQSKLSWSGWSDNKYFNPAYDENYTNSVITMDQEDRREYVYNCQKIHYEDSAFIIFADPYQCFVWRTDTFEGWGDWEEDPGRSIENFWGANPLWFDLEFIGEPPEGFDVTSAAIAGGVVAAVVAAAVLLMMRSRKKKREGRRSPLGE